MKELLSKMEAGWIECDDKLQAIMNCKKFKLTSLSTFLSRHLLHLPPIEIKYMIPGPKARPESSAQKIKRRKGANEKGIDASDDDEDDNPDDDDIFGTKEAQCYDVKISLPLRGCTEGQGFIDRANPEAEVVKLNAELKEIVLKVNEHSRRRDFFLGFSGSPYDFIKDLSVSQSRDMGSMMNREGKEVEARRKSDFYQRKWAGEAALRFLHKDKPSTDMPM